MTRYTGRETPALARLREVAIALGPLVSRVVFIGGAIAPLLQTTPALRRVRATKDVDGVAASNSYADYGRLQEALRARGFIEAGMVDSEPRENHAHRWRSPTGVLFDLVPAGSHLGGTGSRWDAYALESAQHLDISLGPGSAAGVETLVIRHASAAAFLALKWAAYADRGRQDPLTSHDLEDIVALVASRPTLPAECATAPLDVRAFLADRTHDLLRDPEAEELIYVQLGVHDASAIQLQRDVRSRLEQIAAAEASAGP